MFKTPLAVTLALASVLMITDGTHANHFAYGPPGPALAGTAVASYDVTGEMYVSVGGVVNWYIESASHGLTGDAPMNLPGASGLVSDNDQIIGETTGFMPMNYTDVELGSVAAFALPFGDLTINWNAALGGSLFTAPIYTTIGLSPVASINGPFVIDLASDSLNITLDASGSSNPGYPSDLLYAWDLDGLPGYEIYRGTTASLGIADVSQTFGGVGVYPVNVRVSNSKGPVIASTTVTIINTPEPASLTLAILGLLGMVCRGRRRSES